VNRRRISLVGRPARLVLLSALVAGGCQKESQRPVASDTLLGLEADQVLVGVEMNVRNLAITFYGSSGLEEGVLTGREGEYRFETGDVEVRGTVEVTEAVGSKRLVTERLRYSAEADSLYGDTTFVLYRPGIQMRGDSFVSDSKLENVQSLNPSFVSEGDPTSVQSASPE
jgi:hypothetical protein